MTFPERYGPWAIIAGASQGIGRAFVHRIASEGVNCIVVARRAGPLEELAEEVRRQYGVDCLVVAGDLSARDSLDRVLEVVGTREIGLFVNNAGADTLGSRFLEADVDQWMQLADLNIATSIRFCHHFGRLMKARRRGGIVLVGSGACYGGSVFTSVYSGSKAFEMSFAEGLWSELRPHDVQVLFCALGATDTPAFRGLLGRKNSAVPPGLAAPEDVARQVLDRLPEGPVFNWGHADDASDHLPMSASDRRKRVLMIDQASKRIFGDG
jgi:short-subunit dehydrogenase